ncbi:MAG: response regulator transcription factor [Lacisediminihabitans sp.]
MDPIRVALIDDYEVVVRGVAEMLRSYHNRIRVVELDANKQVRDRVDIALYDTFAATRGDQAEIRELVSNPLIGVVAVYSWDLEPAHVEATLANGVGGYISKGLPASRLVAALETIYANGARIHTGRKDTPTIVAGDWPGREEGLTEREAEVLALITQGLSNAEIAERAHLSINSIKTYIRSCYRRIEVNSRTNAVLWGIEHGFRPDHIRISHPEPALSGAKLVAASPAP